MGAQHAQGDGNARLAAAGNQDIQRNLAIRADPWPKPGQPWARRAKSSRMRAARTRRALPGNRQLSVMRIEMRDRVQQLAQADGIGVGAQQPSQGAHATGKNKMKV